MTCGHDGKRHNKREFVASPTSSAWSERRRPPGDRLLPGPRYLRLPRAARRPRPSSDRPGPGSGWPPDAYEVGGHPPWMSGGRTRRPAAPVRPRVAHRHCRGGPPGAHRRRQRPRPARRAASTTARPVAGSPSAHGGPRRSWSAAGPHQRRARRCAREGGSQLPRGGVPALEHGLEPAGDASPCSPSELAPCRTSGPGTHRGRAGTARGRWPAPGCSTPPRPADSLAMSATTPPLSPVVGVSERTRGALLVSEKVAA